MVIIVAAFIIVIGLRFKAGGFLKLIAVIVAIVAVSSQMPDARRRDAEATARATSQPGR